MAGLTSEQIKELKSIVLDYLQGKRISGIQGDLQSVCDDTHFSSKSLFKKIRLDNIEKDVFLIAILASLQLNLSQPYCQALLYRSHNLYELLVNLREDERPHLEYLLELIEKAKPKYSWATLFIIGAILSASLGLFFHFNMGYFEALLTWFSETIPLVLPWMSGTFSMLKNIPLLLIFANAGYLLWSCYQVFTHQITNERLQTLFFKTLTAGLAISAYAISFLAAGAMILPAAILSVLSSSVEVFHGLWLWYKHTKSPHPKNTFEKNDWVSEAEIIRAQSRSSEALKKIAVNAGAAVLVTVAIGIWCFFPPSLVITACSVAFIALVTLAQWSLVSLIHDSSAYDLQEKIRNIKIELPPELVPVHQNAIQNLNLKHHDLQKREQELETKSKALSQRQKILDKREAAIRETLEAVSKGEAVSKFALRKFSNNVPRRHSSFSFFPGEEYKEDILSNEESSNEHETLSLRSNH